MGWGMGPYVRMGHVWRMPVGPCLEGHQEWIVLAWMGWEGSKG